MFYKLFWFYLFVCFLDIEFEQVSAGLDKHGSLSDFWFLTLSNDEENFETNLFPFSRTGTEQVKVNPEAFYLKIKWKWTFLLTFLGKYSKIFPKYKHLRNFYFYYIKWTILLNKFSASGCHCYMLYFKNVTQQERTYS